jgi:hypothetical protein
VEAVTSIRNLSTSHTRLIRIGRAVKKFQKWCNGRTFSNAYLITYNVWSLHPHTCSIDYATAGSSGGRLLLEYFGVRPSHSIWCPLWLWNVSPWGTFSEQGTAKSQVKGCIRFIRVGASHSLSEDGWRSIFRRVMFFRIPVEGHIPKSQQPEELP